jgi:hypothetical protein
MRQRMEHPRRRIWALAYLPEDAFQVRIVSPRDRADHTPFCAIGARPPHRKTICAPTALECLNPPESSIVVRNAAAVSGPKNSAEAHRELTHDDFSLVLPRAAWPKNRTTSATRRVSREIETPSSVFRRKSRASLVQASPLPLTRLKYDRGRPALQDPTGADAPIMAKC